MQWLALNLTEELIVWLNIDEGSCPAEAPENPVRGDDGRYARADMEAAAKLTKFGCICNKTHEKVT